MLSEWNEIIEGPNEPFVHLIRDLHLLLRYFSLFQKGSDRGDELEAAVYACCEKQNWRLFNKAGHLSLFSGKTASGLSHEIDGGITHHTFNTCLEMKAHEGSLNKNEIMVFKQKMFDLYLANYGRTKFRNFKPVIVTPGPIRDELRKFCFIHRLILVERNTVPIPLLLNFFHTGWVEDYFTNISMNAAFDYLHLLIEPWDKIIKVLKHKGGEKVEIDFGRLLSPNYLQECIEIFTTLSSELLEFFDDAYPNYYDDNVIFTVLPKIKDPNQFSKRNISLH